MASELAEPSNQERAVQERQRTRWWADSCAFDAQREPACRHSPRDRRRRRGERKHQACMTGINRRDPCRSSDQVPIRATAAASPARRGHRLSISRIGCRRALMTARPRRRLLATRAERAAVALADRLAHRCYEHQHELQHLRERGRHVTSPQGWPMRMARTSSDRPEARVALRPRCCRRRIRHPGCFCGASM